jgi:hypothetical protein
MYTYTSDNKREWRCQQETIVLYAHSKVLDIGSTSVTQSAAMAWDSMESVVRHFLTYEPCSPSPRLSNVRRIRTSRTTRRAMVPNPTMRTMGIYLLLH